MKSNSKLINWSIGIGLLFPMFFQFSEGVYSGFLQDSGGNIATLPLPISVIVCLGGIALHVKHFHRARIGLTFLAAMLLVMLLSVVFATPELRVEFRKVLLLAQFVMPMFALALGQMVRDEDKVIPKAFLTVLLVVVPSQLVAGWMQGTLTLTHDLYLFSIYQHFQFVPLVFVGAFAYATAALWNSHRTLLLVLFPFMFIYATSSASILTIAAFIIFAAAFFGQRLRSAKNTNRHLILAIIAAGIALAIAVIGVYLDVAKYNSSITGDYGHYMGKFQSISEGKLPTNLSERLADWKLFGAGILESARTMAFGHAAPIARQVRTSAHNWYIDMAYSFGLISLIPVFLLVGYTIYLFLRAQSSRTLETEWLALVLLYLVVVDSSFKVTPRQHYPGIFIFFLWVLLLSRLNAACGSDGRAQVRRNEP